MPVIGRNLVPAYVGGSREITNYKLSGDHMCQYPAMKCFKQSAATSLSLDWCPSAIEVKNLAFCDYSQGEFFTAFALDPKLMSVISYWLENDSRMNEHRTR